MKKQSAHRNAVTTVDATVLTAVHGGDDPNPEGTTPDATSPDDTASNILKTRHDTVKNSIGNVH